MLKTMMQQDLFREAGNVGRMSEDLQAEVVAQLALLIQSVIDAVQREVRDEQDPR
jgi:hypothetical protein